MTRRPVRPAILGRVAILPLIVGLSACSNTQSAANREPYTGSTTAVDAGGIQLVTLTVGVSFRFSPSTITVHPGRVRITLTHEPGGAPHNWQLLGIPGDHVQTINGGQSASVTFVAPAPGRYTFVCTIHERQGQTGTLNVLPG